MEQAHQLEAGWKMLGVVRAEAIQFVNESAGKTLRAGEFWPAMNNAMSDPNNAVKAELLLEPFDDEFATSAVGWGFNGQFLRCAIFIFDRDG